MTILKDTFGSSEEKRREISKMLANAECTVITIDDDLHVALGEGVGDELRELAKKALAKGKVVVWEDKRKQWINTDCITDTSKEGSAVWTWDASGNRVKCERTLHTMHNDGTRTQEVIGTCWRNFD
jgi:hypothetical protein